MEYQEESFLGSGDLNIAVYDASGNKTGELDVGNAITFAINAPSIEKKEQTGFRRANYSQTIKSIITKLEQELKFTLTDINRKNLALAMFGEDSAYSQSAGNSTGSPETITARHDKWVKLGHRNLDPANPPVVKGAGGSPTYTENTDYEVDYQVGRIKALSTGQITDGGSLEVESTWKAQSGYQVQAQKVNKIEAFLRLIGRDQANARDCEVIVHKAEVTPSGDINWLTDDFANLEFTGKILATSGGTWDVIFYETATTTTTTTTTTT